MVPGDALTPREPLFSSRGERIADGVRDRWKRCLPAVGAGLGAWVAFQWLQTSPALAEALVGRGPIPWLTRSLSLATGVVPVPLAELVLVGFVAVQAIGWWRRYGVVRRGERPLATVVTSGALELMRDVGVLVFLFYLLWGFQYARPGLEARLGVEPAGEVASEELRSLAERSVELTNQSYRVLHGTGDLGIPTPRVPLADLIGGLEEGWIRVQGAYDLPGRMRERHGGPKGFIASPVIKRLGIAGMYFPYTGEALVLNDLPGVLQGKDLGHEMAHQRGVSSESDANVLGFLVAAASPEPRVRYSAYAFLQRQLVSALQQVSASDARAVVRAREPGVQRDLHDLYEYWDVARTPVRDAAVRLNDTMLRSHGVEGGVESYRGSTWVFVALARAHGAEALFRTDMAPP